MSFHLDHLLLLLVTDQSLLTGEAEAENENNYNLLQRFVRMELLLHCNSICGRYARCVATNKNYIPMSF